MFVDTSKFTEDQLNEPLKLMEACKRALGFAKNKSTCYRWAKRGVIAKSGQRVYLTHRQIGGELFTTIHDVLAFDNMINHSPIPEPKHKQERERTLAHRKRVRAQLAKLGVNLPAITA
jgi:hypothetical protein